jgi:acetyl-CoA carboxylase, biotin carboxylase subunit
MNTEDFRKGKYNTHFIEKNSDFLLTDGICDRETEDMALIATFAQYVSQLEESKLKNAAPCRYCKGEQSGNVRFI